MKNGSGHTTWGPSSKDPPPARVQALLLKLARSCEFYLILLYLVQDSAVEEQESDWPSLAQCSREGGGLVVTATETAQCPGEVMSSKEVRCGYRRKGQSHKQNLRLPAIVRLASLGGDPVGCLRVPCSKHCRFPAALGAPRSHAGRAVLLQVRLKVGM